MYASEARKHTPPTLPCKMSFRGLIDDPSPLSLIKLCLFSFDIRHMPQGCATWPAAWETLESDWPDSGEIDIVEGVNDVSPNHVTLHSSPNCTMPTGLKMTGSGSRKICVNVYLY